MTAPRMVVEAPSIELTAPEFELAWTALGLGEFPLVLEVTPQGQEIEDMSSAMVRARDTLGRRGLWDPDGGPTARLAAVLRPLDRARAEFDLRVAGSGIHWRALVATRDGRTVLAVHRDATLTFTPISEYSMPAAILDVVPSVAPGSGQVSAPAQQLHRRIVETGGDAYRLGGVLERFGASPRDVPGLVKAMLGAYCVSRIGACTRAEGELRRRSTRIVSLVDTTCGRYLVTDTPNAGGVLWTTWVPADPRRVHGLLEGMINKI